jgi:hypothetical protein
MKLRESFPRLFDSWESIKDRLMRKTTKLEIFVFLGFYAFIVLYSIYQSYIGQVEFSGFPSRFVAFINAVLNDKIQVDLNSLFRIQAFPERYIDPSVSSSLYSLMSTESYFPNMTFLYLIFCNITGLTPIRAMLFPMGAVILPIGFLVLTKVYLSGKTQSTKKLDIVVVIVAVNGILALVVRRNLTVFYVVPVSFLLLFINFICIKKIYEKDHHREFFILFCIVTLSLSLYWHTAAFFSLFFLVSIELVSYLTYRLPRFLLRKYKQKIFPSGITKPIIVGFIISVIFTRLWQSQYLAVFLRVLNPLDLVIKLILRILGRSPFSIPYLYDYTSTFWGKVFHISLLLSYVVSGLMLVFTIAKYKSLPEANETERNEIQRQNASHITFAFSIILAEIIQIFAYYHTESINLFYVFFYPLFSAQLYFGEKGKSYRNGESVEKAIIISTFILIVLNSICVFSLQFSNELGRTPITKFEDTEQSFQWLYSNMENEVVIADFNIMHKYLQREAELYELKTDYMLLTPEIYGIAVGDIKEIPDYLAGNYFVVDRATMLHNLPIDIRGSRGFLLVQLLDLIEENNSLIKIYEDDYVSIYSFDMD